MEVIRPELDTKPLSVVEPKAHDPLSFLLTLQQVGDDVLGGVRRELPGVDLVEANWEVYDRKTFQAQFPEAKLDGRPEDEVIFVREVPDKKVKVAKIYRLARVSEGELDNSDYPAYDLTLEIVLLNTAAEPRDAAG